MYKIFYIKLKIYSIYNVQKPNLCTHLLFYKAFFKTDIIFWYLQILVTI